MDRAAAMSQEAVDEVREGSMPGAAELDTQICYHAVVTTKSVLHF